MLPAVFFLPLPDTLTLPLSLLLRVIVPALLASAAIAVASVVFAQSDDGRTSSLREALRSLGPLTREVAAAGLLAGMIALAFVVFLGGFGLMLLPLFYGPPIIVQVISIETLPLQLAFPRTKEVMRGNWLKVIAALALIVLLIATVGAAGLSAGFALVDGSSDGFRAVFFTIIQAIVVGLTLPYLAAAQFVAFTEVKRIAA